MFPSQAFSIRSLLFKNASLSALILWACMWCNLNTGFWNIQIAENVDDWQLSIRAFLPFIVLPLAAFLLLHRRNLLLPRSAPSRLLLVYGSVATLSSVFSPEPMWALYWSIAFLATILAAWTFIDPKDRVGTARQLLVVTWVAAFIVAAIIGYQARNSIFGELAGKHSLMRDLSGESRSSGVARWAAVPGWVCLVRAGHSRRAALIAFFLGAATVSFFIVYRMQSRGAVFGSVASLLFILAITTRMRRYALPLAMMAIVMIILVETPAVVSDKVVTYLERGQSKEEFLSMTGRTRAYSHGLASFKETPIFGRGQWADRLTIGEHVHNSFLQALMNAGVVGGIPYFASWGAGWMLFYRLHRRRRQLHPDDRIHLLECGAVMMFFTIRAIPETTTASFAVDLLVMVAVYVFLESLTVQIGSKWALRPVEPLYSVSFGGPPQAKVRSAAFR
jgi:O-antigen ligase